MSCRFFFGFIEFFKKPAQFKGCGFTQKRFTRFRAPTITSGIGQSLLQCGPSGSSAHSVQRPARIQKLPSSSQIA